MEVTGFEKLNRYCDISEFINKLWNINLPQREAFPGGSIPPVVFETSKQS